MKQGYEPGGGLRPTIVNDHQWKRITSQTGRISVVNLNAYADIEHNKMLSAILSLDLL